MIELHYYDEARTHVACRGTHSVSITPIQHEILTILVQRLTEGKPISIGALGNELQATRHARPGNTTILAAIENLREALHPLGVTVKHPMGIGLHLAETREKTT